MKAKVSLVNEYDLPPGSAVKVSLRLLGYASLPKLDKDGEVELPPAEINESNVLDVFVESNTQSRAETDKFL